MPNVNLGTARVAIRARDEGVQAAARRAVEGLQRVRRASQNVSAQLRILNTASRTTNRVLGALGLVALTGRFRNFANEAAELGASLVESANTAGLSISEFQLLQRTFEGDGVAAESFRSSLTFLQRRLGDLERGVPTTVEYFEQLGLSWENLRGRDLSGVLDGIADGLRAIEDPNLRVAIATQLLGRSAADMVTVLERGSEGLDEGRRQFRLYDVVSRDTAETLKALQQEFTNTGYVVSVNLANAVASVAPQIEEFSRSFRTLAVNIGPIVTGFADIFTSFRNLGLQASGTLVALRFMSQILRIIRATLRLNIGTAGSFSEALRIIWQSVLVTLSAFGRVIAVLYGVNLAIRAGIDAWDAYSEAEARAETSTFRLGRRLQTLADRIQDFGIEGEGFGFVGRLLNAFGTAQDVAELDRIVSRYLELLGRAANVRALPGLPPGYNVLTGTISDPQAAARQEAEQRQAEEAQRRLNEFVQERIALYRRLADLRRQVEIPAAAPVEVQAPQQDAVEQIQQAALGVTRRTLEAQGGLTEEVERYVRILGQAQNQRFLENQLIDIGVRQAEQAVQAQVRAGQISQETAESTLIVNRRIAELSSARLTADAEQRDAIVAVLDDLQSRYPEIVAELATALEGLTDRLSFQAQALQTVTQGFARGLERGILRAVRQGGRLLDIFQRIGQEILGTILSGLTRLGINALFGAIGLPGFATRHEGGRVRGGQLYGTIPGELFIPSTDGTVLRPQGRGATVINIDARGGDEASFNRAITRALPEIAEAVGTSTEAQIRFGLRNPSPLREVA